ncbi:MAG: sulfite exporter TauE/SafE family protein [Candidatus Eremiobacteraeota bacterium]|nr:sulfite exporter TauE/SafE family protein [Candidatus Eremiobacteraeota bacterium]
MTVLNLEIILVGLVVGTIVGLTGVGGASIMTPLLILVLHVNPLKAVGTDLLYSVPTKLYGAFLHNKQGTVNPEIVKALLWGGLPASLVGLAALFWLRHHVDVVQVELWTRHGIGFVLFIAAAVILVQPFIKRRMIPMTSTEFEWQPRQRTRVMLIGALVGLIVTATSIGSGSVTLPLLALTLPFVGMAQLVGSDIAFAAFLIPAAAAGRWSMGDVNLPLVLWLLVGSIPGVYIGSKLCGKLSQSWLRPVVAVTLVFVGTRLI